ncbi:MAG TPA: hypothetical protein VND42_01210 [Candidatus Acidoferrales bacterium]|nr:hypothetical protein [Candidatus Acidoferrales bacterium]
MAALFAFVLYLMLKEKFGGAASFAAGIVLLTSPAVQAQSAMVMADIPVALFSLLAAMSFGRFLDTECSLDVVGFGECSLPSPYDGALRYLPRLRNGAATESVLRLAVLPTALPGRFHTKISQYMVFSIGNCIHSPANATDSERATYIFLIGNEFRFCAVQFFSPLPISISWSRLAKDLKASPHSCFFSSRGVQ